jgi:hypothetical protein
MLKNNNRKKIFIAGIIIVTAIRMLLFLKTPLWGTSNLPHDDTLMIEIAGNIINGDWLGAYTDKTLIKGVSYPLFLAFCSYLGIPYLLGVGILYLLSIWIFIYAFKHIIKNRTQKFIIYVFLLFSPTMFEFDYIQRVYRMSLIPCQVLLIISCFSGMYVRLKKGINNILPWAIGGGVSLIFFWLTREDSIWMLPFILSASIISIISVFLIHWKNIGLLIKKSAIIIIPILILIGGINLVKYINYVNYGVYEINDLKNSGFSELMGNIYTVKQDEEIPYVWVNRSTISKLYDVSPTLNSIRKEFEDSLDGWDLNGLTKDDKEVEKDYVMWALRDAVKSAGYYNDAVETEEFYKIINDEINKAFNDGRLEKNIGFSISTLSRPFKQEYIKPLIECSLESMEWVVNYSKCSIRANESIGLNDTLRKFEVITNGKLIYPEDKQLAMNGWIFSVNPYDKLYVKIIDDYGNDIKDLKKFENSQDVYNYFENIGQEYINSQQSRFKVNLSDLEDINLYAQIYINDQLVDTLDLNDDKEYYENDKYILCFDEKAINNTEDSYKSIAIKNIKPMNFVIKLYSSTGLAIALSGLICYLIISILMIKGLVKKDYNLVNDWLIITGIALTFIVLILGVSYNYFEAWNRDGRNVYLAGAYPLMQMFIALSISSFYLNVKKFIKEKKINEINNTNTML